MFHLEGYPTPHKFALSDGLVGLGKRPLAIR